MDTVSSEEIEMRLDQLISNGIIIHDRRQVFIGAEVSLDNILPGAQLFPGTRITGSRSVLGPNSIIGSEGPATLDNVVLDDGAEVASGFVTNSALLRGSRVGSNGHIRACTILEEEASTAHAVGLKQTILMSYVTLGSLINFCDGIVSGGRSRSDHTEIGSGFINFNFTPWGERGDKATPTLIGEIYRGVFLENDRIFLGGSSGIIGPAQVSFGACTVAGQIIRQDIGPNTIFSSTGRNLKQPINVRSHTFSERKYRLNLNFIAGLVALRAWYRQVRLLRIPGMSEFQHKRSVIDFAAQLIDGMIAERIARLTDYLKSFKRVVPEGNFTSPACPIEIVPNAADHIDWVRSLNPQDAKLLEEWLREIGDSVWPD
jgi:hypothetical protein